MRGFARVVAAVFLPLLMGYGTGVAAAENVDTVFVVDGSGSMLLNDPTNHRSLVVGLLADFSRAYPGDRLGLVQFAGWEETQDPVVLGLTAVPEHEPAKFTAAVAKALARLRPIGMASDLNAAFEKGVAEVLRGHGRRPVWVILLTDDEPNYVEGDKTRKEYEQRAAQPEHAGKPLRLAVTSAANKLLLEETLPRFGALEEGKICYTPVYLGEGAPGRIFEKIAELGAKSQVINLRKIMTDPEAKPLTETLLQLLRLRPAAASLADLGYGGQYELVGGKRTHTFNVRLFGGGTKTRLVLVSQASRLTARLEEKGAKVTTLGEGTAYRIFELEGAPAGTYRLTVGNLEAVSRGFELMVFDRLVVKAKTELVAHGPSGPFELKIALFDAQDRPLRDPELLQGATATVQWTSPAGKETTTALAFPGPALSHTFRDPDRVTLGDWKFSATVKSAKTSEFQAAKEPQPLFTTSIPQQTVRKSALLSLRPPSGAAFFQGQLVPLSVEYRSPLPDDLERRQTVSLRLLPPKAAAPEEFPLEWDEAGKVYLGQLPLSQDGTYQLLASETDWYALEVPPGMRIDVSKRNFAVNPPEATFKVDYGRSGKKDRAQFEVELSLAPEEQAEVSISPAGTEDYEYSLVGGPRLSFDHRRQKQTVEVEFVTKKGLFSEEQPWSGIKFTPWLKDQGVAAAEPVDVKVSVKLENWWGYWAPWIIAGALLLLLLLALLLWYLTNPQWEKQQLRPIFADLPAEQAYLMGSADLPGGKRRARGTPEIESALDFRLKGRSWNARASVKPGPAGLRIEVNGEPLTNERRLKHADAITVHPAAGEPIKYHYFDREPTAEEIQPPPRVILEPDEFVVLADQ